jgi:iron(III) transport system substrate-binding protein
MRRSSAKKRGAVRPRALAVATAALAALALAACSSSSGGPEANSPTPAPQTTPTTPTTVTSPTPTPGDSTPSEAAVPELDPAIIAAAKAEGTAHAYWALDQVTGDNIAKAFKEAYGIELTFERNPDSAALDARFRSESDDNKPGTDVIIIASPDILNKSANDGYLLKPPAWDIPNLANVPSNFVYDGYATVGVYQLNNIVVNTQKVAAADIPHTWEQLADPKWKGKILTGDPRSARMAIAIFNTVSKMDGDNWLTEMAAQDITYVASQVTAVQQVAAGDYLFTFGPGQTHLNPLLASAPDAPVELVHMDGPFFAAEWTLGMPAKAAHPNASKVLINWLYSPEGQIALNGMIGTSVIPGVVVPGFDPLPTDPNAFVQLGDNVPQADRRAQILDLIGLTE